MPGWQTGQSGLLRCAITMRLDWMPAVGAWLPCFCVRDDVLLKALVLLPDGCNSANWLSPRLLPR